MESANVMFDEYTKVHEDESKKEPENYRTFVYFYEGMSNEADNSVNQVVNRQESVIVESHTMNVELQSGVELHSGVELQSEVEVHYDTKIILHEMNFELHDREVHNESKI